MYQEVVKILLMDMADTTPSEARTRRLKELRGTRTLRAMAAAMVQATGGEVDVTPQAISNWEKEGQVSRKHAQAYDDALGAGGEVLSMLGYAASTATRPTRRTIRRRHRLVWHSIRPHPSHWANSVVDSIPFPSVS